MVLGKGKHADEMSFVEHLEALRWHIIRSLVAVVLVAIVAFLNRHIVFDVIVLAPKNPDFFSYQALCWLSNNLSLGDALCITNIDFMLQNVDMAGQFLTHMKVSFVAGIIVAFPYIFWEFWRFVRPALYEKEQKSARGLVFVCSTLFLAGVAFGYFIITPFSVNFLGNYQVSEQVYNEINLGSFISIITMISLASGIIFELPVASYLLSKIGLLTPAFMKKYRKHAFIVILILSAVITPPDITSQIIISIPIVILYEVSIWISKRVNDKFEKEMAN